ncbi:MAG: cell division protein FtsL [Defluviitaleaceae bacterium]|nr:cell division protein FtsL [Defluviitaleaceae bacterium]MCL2238870.1 cell division protein FtsL [Defluviitaleaceae bacterium]
MNPRPPQPTKKRPPSISPTPKKGGNVVYLKRGDTVHKVDAQKQRFALSAPMVFTIILIFIGALSSAVASAYIADMRREVTLARHARDTQLDANRTLASQMPQPFTLDEIEAIALERLGMARPDPSQIIYIHVPPVSHVVFNPYAYILPPSTTFWEEMGAFLRGIIDSVFGG